MNFYPKYPADFMSKTMHLSMEEDGAFNRLLDWYYSNGRGIPNRERFIIARAANPSEKRAVSRVLSEFFSLENGTWINARADAEIARALPRIEKARNNGRKGGRPPKAKPSGLATQNPVGSENETQREPTGIPDGLTTHNQNHKKLPTDTSTHTPPSGEFVGALVGSFEGHEPNGQSGSNPAAPFAVALRRAGVKVTSMNPELIAYVKAGGTVDHLLELADQHGTRGAGYVLTVARRELAEQARPIVTSEPTPITAAGRRPGQTMTALALLQEDKTWNG